MPSDYTRIGGIMVPIRFPSSREDTDDWLRVNVPRIRPEQFPEFEAELRARGWTDSELRQRVYPLKRRA